MYSKKITLSLAVLLFSTSLPVSAWAMDDPQNQRGVPLKIDASRSIENETFRHCEQDLENLLNVAMSLKAPETKKRMNAFKAIERLSSSNEEADTYAQRKDRPYRGRIISAELTQEKLDRMNNTVAINRAITEISNVLDEDTYSRLGFDKLLKEENKNASVLSKINYFETRVLLRQMAYYYMEYFGLDGSADQPVPSIGRFLISEMPYQLRSNLASGRWNNTFSIFGTDDFPYWWELSHSMNREKPELHWSSEPSIKGSHFFLSTNLGDLSQYSGKTLTVSLDMMCSEFTPQTFDSPSIVLDNSLSSGCSKLYYQQYKIEELEEKNRKFGDIGTGTDKEAEAAAAKTEIQNLTLKLREKAWLPMAVSTMLTPSSNNPTFKIDVTRLAAFKVRNLKITIDGKEVK